MKTLTSVVLAILVVCSLGWLEAADAQRVDSVRAPSASSIPVPGPPLWRPPAERPRVKVATTDFEELVDLCVTDQMGAVDTPGASVAVIVDGELVYEQGYGVTQRGGTDEVDADTQFRIGSVTKMLTAAAVLQQVEAGTVFLDDRLSRYVPELDLIGHWPSEAITIQHLLTHSSGIPDLNFGPNGLTGSTALADWVESLRWVGLHAPPGSFYNYSNPNFNLAGLVVERASGMEYRSYMENHVFGPAGLADTTFDPAAVAARGNASHGHTPDGEGGETIYAPDDYDNGAFAPAGYAYSTAGDLVRWALLLGDGGGAVLSESSALAMQSIQQSLETLPGLGYGYGVFIEPYFDLTVRQHGGNIWGWGAFLLWHPEQRFAVAVLANTFQSLPGAAYCVANEVLDPDFEVTIEPPPPDPERWRQLFQRTLDGSVTTSWAQSSPYPIMGEASEIDDERMLLHLWDPASFWSALWFLDYVYGDLFYVDVDNDGSYDLDVTFLTSTGPPEQLRWMRMRPVVGYPQEDPRSSERNP